MNKFKFLVEIETPKNISKDDFDCCVRRGLMQYYGHLPNSSYEVFEIENNVEQNVERPKDQQKWVDLLVKAKRRLNDSAAYEDGKDNDDLVKEINEFLIERK